MNIHIPVCPLSARQLEVIKWLSFGKSAEEIGIIMGIKRRTAQAHLAQAKDAIGAGKNTALVATALREGWIQ
ncbi:helix-turn-helix transcriptional regulator [Rhizobium sp. Root1204]|uniref:helix-turn-helix transcriptional regulator n=1 Tax=Rhizobium sp. Root1204 TaxID=1736428 RepID=UPI000713482B|nr:LuxR C-terminal-related transcriptional regulator [Rhizobium sp. Root1204]KQV31128.1 hypothetical protein ASC96_08020 [Rhizobium sp. Root1204]